MVGDRWPGTIALSLSPLSHPADLLGVLPLPTAHAAGTGAAEKGATSGGK